MNSTLRTLLAVFCIVVITVCTILLVGGKALVQQRCRLRLCNNK